jgi:hypothetical protein
MSRWGQANETCPSLAAPGLLSARPMDSLVPLALAQPPVAPRPCPRPQAVHKAALCRWPVVAHKATGGSGSGGGGGRNFITAQSYAFHSRALTFWGFSIISYSISHLLSTVHKTAKIGSHARNRFETYVVHESGVPSVRGNVEQLTFHVFGAAVFRLDSSGKLARG